MTSVDSVRQAVRSLRDLPEWLVARAAKDVVDGDSSWRSTYMASRPDYEKRDQLSLGELHVLIRDVDVTVYATVLSNFSRGLSDTRPELVVSLTENALIALATAATAIAGKQASLVMTGAAVALSQNGEPSADAHPRVERGGIAFR